ncbi:MAG: hypothetical protein JNM91_07985, partial [Flavobacteriales bacterium]|nr:hypothetical protein [Flavobacteriales bacterium]
MSTADGRLLAIGGERIHAMAPTVPGVRSFPGVLGLLNTNVVPAIADDGYWAVHFYDSRWLARLDSSGNEVYRVTFPEEDLPYEPFQVFRSRSGRVWVASTKGLWEHVPGTPHVTRVPQVPAQLEVRNITEDEQGRLWLSLHTLGTYRFDPRDGSCIPVPTSEGTARPLSLNTVQLGGNEVLLMDHGQRPLIVGTTDLRTRPFAEASVPDHVFTGVLGGVKLIDGRVVLYSVSHGLKCFRRNAAGAYALDHTWGIPTRPSLEDAAVDGAGRVWCTSLEGTYLLDPAAGSVQRLDLRHGVPRVQNTHVVQCPNGDVFLSGNGCLRIAPAFRAALGTSELVLRSITVNGAPRPSAVSTNAPLLLAHDQNNLGFRYSCIALMEGDAFTYRYRLLRDGTLVDSATVGSSRNVNLLGLVPGDYRLELHAEGPTSSPAPLVRSFVISPAWWQRWWARTLFALLIVVLVVLGTRQVLSARYR